MAAIKQSKLRCTANDESGLRRVREDTSERLRRLLTAENHHFAVLLIQLDHSCQRRLNIGEQEEHHQERPM